MAGSTADHVVSGDQEGERTAFATQLRAAIATSGLSLDRIQARLRARGVVVSVTALSYWQSGKRQPERQSSLSAVRTLEEILDVPAGSLLGLLPPPRPRGGAGKRQAGGEPMSFPREVLQPLLDKVGAPNALERQHPLKLVGLHDLCEIAEDGGQRSVTARAVFQAGSDGQDRWLLVYTQDDPAAGPPELHAVRNCRIGRAEVDEAHGLVVAELVFDQPINRGETHLIEYTLTNSGPPYPECRNTHYREFRRPVREYLLEVRFAPGTAPDRCWQYAHHGSGGTLTRRRLKLDGGDGVHAVALDFGPGVFGIDWD
ncbi:hypothetical protein VA596_38900 [Amycolatopsis sp., V23-08]|uniref:XRE family transcriptional regulator n=1 Tax=Amycolatopsis heterodermiae TaxID=3110235 RepID=A0ABU5RH06_9PSEU|nr:hypothetical protein [Amycolatopsis sp., V23-08]MEA5365548.1 hypothetical protein [Amycolatopsis sp., V23-08]